MKIRYAKHMKKLVRLTEKLRLQAQSNGKYYTTYLKLCEAVDAAEKNVLIKYTPETKKEWE